MSRRWYSLGVFGRIRLLALGPAALFAALGLALIASNLADHWRLSRYTDYLVADIYLDQLVHALQFERGQSVLRTEQRQNRQEFPLIESFRADTDALRGQAFEVAGREHAELAAILAQARKDFDRDLERVRAAIDRDRLASERLFDDYTGIIERLLDLQNGFIIRAEEGLPAGSQGLRNVTKAQIILARMKEMAGRERAIAVIAFSRNGFGEANVLRFADIVAQQGSLLKVFEILVPREGFSLFEMVRAIDAQYGIGPIRDALLAGAGAKDSALDPGSWFQLATRKVDAIKGLEDRLHDLAFSLVDKRRSDLNWQSAGGLAVVLILLTLGLMAARRTTAAVSAPLSRLGKAIESLRAGDRQIGIEDQDREDEIGAMARAVEQFRLGLVRADELAESQGRTRRLLTQAQERLVGAIESLNEGFILYDAEDRIVYVNAQCRAMLAEVSDYLRPGIVYDDFIRGLAERGYIPQATGRADLYLAERRAARAKPRSLVDVQIRDGRWIRIITGRTPSGEVVEIRRDITADVRREAALKEGEARKTAMLGAALDGIIVMDTEGRIVDFNANAETIFGVRRDAVIGQELADMIIPPHLREAHRQAFRRQLATGESRILGRRIEVTAWRNDQEFPVELAVSRFEADGRPMFVAYLRDISDRKAAEAAIRDSEATLRTLINANADDYMAFWGQGEELRIANFFPPADVTAMGREVANSGKPQRFEGRIDDQWFDFNFYPALASGGEQIGVAVFARNITARKQSEETLRKLSQAVDQSPASVVITDPLGTIEYVNPRFSELTGYAPSEVIGRNPRLLKSGFTSSRQYEELWRTITTGGQWQGEFHNRKKDGQFYWAAATISPIKEKSGAITHFLGVSEDITVRKEYEERLLRQANYDELTGLPNRLLAIDRLNQAIAQANRDNTNVVILIVDLDDFKKVNDTLGHPIGDRLIQEAGERIRHCVRENDTLARLGGDEFLVILPGLAVPVFGELVAKKVLEIFSLPFAIEGHDIFTTASVGITVYPRDGESSAVLMRNADAAMYRAKELGRNAYRYFTPQMNQQATERMRMEAQLRYALERQELFLHYQPILDPRTGLVLGGEALLRWRNPELGFVPPDRFIPLAEETGLIVTIGAWVIEESCRRCAEWRREIGRPLHVAVNISSRQFRGSDLLAIVRLALNSAGLPPDGLELEVTERLLMRDIDETLLILGELNQMGVRLSIDDFGTGYSSLSYLKRFPFDTLKIDKSFVQGIGVDNEDAAIVDAVVAMARALGLQVIAEGVETEGQRDYLIGQGAEFVQGYLFCKPVAAKDFLAYLENAPAP